ncbi:MAG TPA: TRAP transporter substrate-binding protein DctP [Thermodesulfobacteriota bacterium]|nr:TRAP transporter substrate-binding protein DctP [Thermodesulfobacteriota bacterium]
MKAGRLLAIFSGILALFSCLPGQAAAAEKTYEFKISVDTVPNHPRNMGLVIFIEELQKRSAGKLVPKYYHSAQLYKDAHVTKALRTGTVEMAIPGNWVLEGFDTSTSLTMLPMFFGQPGNVTEQLVDGEVGNAVNQSLEKKVGVKSPGRWFELGIDQTWFRNKKVTKMDDFKGLKMRHSGGSIPEERLNALGASAVFIAWPDVPMALVQGTVDGICSTAKSVESAKLYEAGIKYGLFNTNFNGYYVPLVNLKFWNSLPKDLQKIFMDVWNETVPKQREIARREQLEARKIMESKGVEIFEPSQEELAKWRNHIMPIQDKLVKDLKHDPALVALAKKALKM